MIYVGSSPAHPQVNGKPTVPPSFADNPSLPAVKTRLCNNYNSAEGCKFGDKCHFAHGGRVLGKPTVPSYEDTRALGLMQRKVVGQVYLQHMELQPALEPLLLLRLVLINSSLAGSIIGKNGINSEQICRMTGASLSIRDHDADPNLNNIELEGSFVQIKKASAMVRKRIVNDGSISRPSMKNITEHASAPVAT